MICLVGLQGHNLFEFLPAGETIDSDKYCRQLTNLNREIKEKRQILSDRKGVIFHQDNARPHVSKKTLCKLKSLKWDVLTHPPYSPDIALPDYHLFRSLQNYLNGKNFDSLESLKNGVSSFFESKPRSFYDRGIRLLPERWKKIIENDGKYIID